MQAHHLRCPPLPLRWVDTVDKSCRLARGSQLHAGSPPARPPTCAEQHAGSAAGQHHLCGVGGTEAGHTHPPFWCALQPELLPASRAEESGTGRPLKEIWPAATRACADLISRCSNVECAGCATAAAIAPLPGDLRQLWPPWARGLQLLSFSQGNPLCASGTATQPPPLHAM